MAKDDPPAERSGYRVIRSWRERGAWFVAQDDYPESREAWAAYHGAAEHIAGRGDEAQVDLYDLGRGEVLETARAGTRLLKADELVIDPDELHRRIRSLFAKPPEIDLAQLPEGDSA